MTSLFGGWGASETGALKVGSTIELKAADAIKPVSNRNDGLKVFVEMWNNQCRYRAVVACIELQLPDLLGSDSLTIEDISERAACENVDALKSLCDTLVSAGVLEYTSEQRYVLTDAGALLQRGLDTNITDIMDAMISAKVSDAWNNLTATIVKKSEMDDTVDDDVLTMHCDDLEADIEGELRQVFDTFEPFGENIMYWGVENASDILASMFPNSTITQIHSSNQLVGPIDLLILHRTMAVYGLSTVVDACTSSLSFDGSIILIDTVEHPAACTNDLYAHAASLPCRLTEEEWKEMWGEMQPSSPFYLRDGLISFQFVAPTRI